MAKPKSIETLNQEIDDLQTQINTLTNELSGATPETQEIIREKINNIKKAIKRREKKMSVDNSDNVSTKSFASDNYSSLLRPIEPEVSFAPNVDFNYTEVPIFDAELDKQFVDCEKPGEREALIASIGRIDVILGRKSQLKGLGINELRTLKSSLKTEAESIRYNVAEVTANVYMHCMSSVLEFTNTWSDDTGVEFVNPLEEFNKYKAEFIKSIKDEFTGSPELFAVATKLTSGYAGIAIYTTLASMNACKKKDRKVE